MIRAAATNTSAADIGAYLVLSHGRAAQQSPTTTHERSRVGVVMRSENPKATASAAGISGYTANALKRNGAVATTAAHPKVAAPSALVATSAVRHIKAAATAAMITNTITTA